MERKIICAVKVEPGWHCAKMQEGVVGRGQFIACYEAKGSSNLVCNGTDYLFLPVFEAGFFFPVLFFFLCAAFCFLPFEESRAGAPALAGAFR